MSSTPEDTIDPEVIVLLSGGIDSACCVNFFRRLGRPVGCIHVSYGQLASKHEKRAAKHIARHYRVPITFAEWRVPGEKPLGEIAHRNAFLVLAAAMEAPPTACVLSLGIHSFTQFPDCSTEFIRSIESVLKLFTTPRLTIAAPFIGFSKAELIEYAANNSIPLELTYSCEAGTSPPCGECRSCRDREHAHAST